MIPTKRIHYIQMIPFLLLSILSAWHLHAYASTAALGGNAMHLGGLTVTWTLALASVFLRNSGKALTRYAESVIGPVRNHMAGAACFVLGGIHLAAVPAESVFLKMGFLVLLLAFFETAGMANRFMPALSGEPAEVTRGTVKRLLLHQLGMLAMVFVLSAVLLYMSLMVVVGFSETWTVAMLAAVLLLAMAFMTMIRRI